MNKCKVQSAKCKVQSAKCKVSNIETVMYVLRKHVIKKTRNI